MSVELATAYLSVVPSLKDAGRHLSEPLGTAGDQAGKRFSGGFSKSAKRGLAVAGIGLAGGLAAIFKTGFDEVKDASAGTAQLAAGIKSTGNAANVTVGGLNNLASKIEGYSGQTDDSIVATEKLLLTFTNIKNQGPDKIFDQATTAAADMAAKLGGDASASAIQLGKALNDPVKGISALSRVGVSFTKQQKAQVAAMVKTGDTAGAQKLILRELNKEFGGAAKAAGESIPGQMERAKRSFEGVSQQIVTALLPLVTKLFTFIKIYGIPALQAFGSFITANVIPAVSSLASWIGVHVVPVVKSMAMWVKQNADWLKPFVITILAVIAAVKVFTIVTAALNIVLAANPLVLIGVLLAAVVVAIILAYRKFSVFRDVVKVVWTVVKTYFQIGWAVIKGIFEGIKVGIRVVAAVVSVIARAIGLYFRGIGAAISLAWAVIRRVYGWIKSGLAGVKNFVVGIAKGLWNGLTSGLSAAWGFIKGILDQIAGAIQSVKDAIASLADSQSLDLAGDIKEGGKKLGAPGRAVGGPVTKGQPYIVGERRPELFIPDTNGRIVPRVPSAGGGGGIGDASALVAEMRAVRAAVERNAAETAAALNGVARNANRRGATMPAGMPR